MKVDRAGRLRFLQIVFLIIPLLLVLRLVDLQIIHYRFYKEKSEEQRRRIILPAAHRGDILDRAGRLLATMLDVVSVYAVPSKVKDPPRTAKILAPVLGESEAHLLNLLSTRKSFIWLKRKLEPNRLATLRHMDLPGIQFLEEKKRIYPHGHLASQLLGFVGIDNEGLSGMELDFETWLRGKAGKILIEGDPLGRQIAGGERREVEVPERGFNLVLSLDLYLQHVAEKTLFQAVTQYHGLSGTAIAMDVQTGEILALASFPDFNPNAYDKSPPGHWRPRAITDLYEPGSTFKVITTVSALDEGAIHKDTKVRFLEKIQVGGKTIGNSHPIHTLPSLYSVTDMLCQSVNTGAVQVALKLGKEKFYRHMRAFGFGEKQLDEFPGEAAGLLRSPDRWYAPDIAMMSFGQSIAVTPLQLLSAYSSIARGGERIRPVLAKRLEQDDGSQVRSFSGAYQGRAVSEKAARTVLDMMEQVVLRGSGHHAQIAGYRVGGKTGTAQKAVHGQYVKGRFIASFIGIVPMTRPRLAILLAVDEPKGSIWGETVAAPYVRKIAEAAVSYLGIPPDNVQALEAGP